MQAVLNFPDLSPELFSISLFGMEFALRWYALAYIVGILIAWRLGTMALKRPALWPAETPPMKPQQLEDLITWIILGVILGLDVVSPLLPAVSAKLFFVSTWFSFAGALFWMNKDKNRPVFDTITHFTPHHALLLFGTGILGGLVSGTVGSGLDIVTFALLVLAFRINEKIATPTSVVLMGINALVGVLWREGVTTGMALEAWNYWYVCVPIVVIGAPAGARFIYRRSRQFIVGFLYFSIIVQYLAALIILPLTTALVVFSIVVLILGLTCFHYMAHVGHRRLATLPAGPTNNTDTTPGNAR